MKKLSIFTPEKVQVAQNIYDAETAPWEFIQFPLQYAFLMAGGRNG